MKKTSNQKFEKITLTKKHITTCKDKNRKGRQVY